jgi:insertion element IS1 protein InsB
VNPYFPSGPGASPLEVEIRRDAEADEFWSYVGNKKNQRWTWYAIERETGVVLAFHNGKRTDESCCCLMEKLSRFPIRYFYTDNWRSYGKYIPESRHVVGKKNTWKIERRNLNFRTHIKRLSRKTICFSKDEKIHDNVIGTYINRYYFTSSPFLKPG